MELQVESDDGKETFWTVFAHANIDAKERQEQWKELRARRQTWGEKWVKRGDFNDIKGRGGERRKEKTRKQFFIFKKFHCEYRNGRHKIQRRCIHMGK